MMNRLPSTKQLQVFLATAQHLNFTHAAEAMNMTQGAMSRQIQTLEALIGVALFHRHARGLSLTPEGERFVVCAEEIVNQLRKAITDVADGANTIRLNAPTCITSWLLGRLAEFHQQFPDINVELTSTNKHQSSPNFDSFDMAILYGKAIKNKTTNQVLLFEERLSPLCAPELWPEVSQTFEDKVGALAELPWLHANVEQTDWYLWLEAFAPQLKKSSRNQTFATLDQAVGAAQLGYGIAVGDLVLAERDLKLNRLVQPFDECVLSGNGYYLMTPVGTEQPNILRLVEWLAKHTPPRW
ncbi:LysR substrate-binding domain-containing protein [Vibrio sinaloensis]|uniref:LysR substrate-binding domain-containing protein n=1 Tax=Photobacterium sp. (strain ATCC 43367) TaxID=379097 RepID=UPI0035EDA5F2